MAQEEKVSPNREAQPIEKETEMENNESAASASEATVEEPTQQPAAEEQESEVEALKKKVEEQSAQIVELEDIKLRQMAEFDNFRRKKQQEILSLLDTAGERIFKDMLPLIDDFERCLATQAKLGEGQEMSPREASLMQGMEMVYKKFIKFLSDNKVSEIEAKDKDFNTDEHEAITLFAAGEDKKGKVIECTQKGYKLGEKVIRYAKVVVGE